MEKVRLKRKAQALRHLLDATTEELGQFIKREETRESTGKYLKGLLTSVERKNTWQLSD